MKKIVMIMALAMGTMGFVSCSDDNDEDELTCAELEQNIARAGTEFGQNQNRETCQAYRAALQDYIDEERCTENRDIYQAQLDALECSEFESGI